jgi:hypothetical protein
VRLSQNHKQNSWYKCSGGFLLTLQSAHKLLIAFETWKMFLRLAVHKVAAGLGPERAFKHVRCPIVLVSRFASHWNKTGTCFQSWPNIIAAVIYTQWHTWREPDHHWCASVISYPHVWGLLTKQVHEQIFKTKYARNFKRKNNVEWIPPTKAAMEVHVKQATYQRGHVHTPSTRAATGNQLGVDQKSGGIVWASVDNVTTNSAKLPWTPVL